MMPSKCALVVGALLPLVALAQDGQSPMVEPPGANPAQVGPEVDRVRPPPEPTEEELGQKELKGRIGKIDERTGRFSLELAARNDVRVTRDGRSASFRDLEEGDSVRAVLDETSTRVVEIEALSPERRRQLRDEARRNADVWK